MVKKKKESKLKFTKLGIILWIVAIIMILSYTTYAFYAGSFTGTKTYTVTSGVLTLTFSGESNVLSLTSALPTTDTDGSSGTPYSFTIKNTSGIAVDYNFKMTSVCCTALVDGVCTDDTLSSDILRYKLVDVDNSTNTISVNPNANMLASDKTLTADGGLNDTDSYQLYIWIADTATNSDVYTNNVGKVYCAKLEATGTQDH